jgi:hypothetical protein
VALKSNTTTRKMSIHSPQFGKIRAIDTMYKSFFATIEQPLLQLLFAAFYILPEFARCKATTLIPSSHATSSQTWASMTILQRW